MEPHECELCGAEFYRRPLLVERAAHEAARYGEGAARAIVDEELEWFHADHDE